MPFRLKLARIAAVDGSCGPRDAFVQAQQVPVADVWEEEKLHATKAWLVTKRSFVCPAEATELLQDAHVEFGDAAVAHGEAVDADLPRWADVAAPWNDTCHRYVKWRLHIEDDVADCKDFADPVEQTISGLQGDIMDILEATPILPYNQEALLFLVLRIIQFNRLSGPELGALLDQIIAALAPRTRNASIAPGQAVFIALKASLFATAGDPAAVILLKNSALAAEDHLNASVRILDLLSIALSATGVFPGAAAGVAEYAHQQRDRLMNVSPFLDDDSLWAPVVEQLRGSVDRRREI